MAKQSEKLPMKEVFRVHRRAFVDLNQYCPGLFLSLTLHAIAKSISPYVTVYMSARIINELAGLQRPEILWKLVLLTLICTAAATLLTGLLYRWEQSNISKYYTRKQRVFTDKLLSMDFLDIDKTETHDLLSQIRQLENWSWWGYGMMVESYSNLVKSIMGILGAVVLTVSLFTLSVPDSSGTLIILNHPAFLAVAVAAIGFITWLSPVCRNKANDYMVSHTEDAKLGNRLFGAFGFVSDEQHRAADFRMYNQQNLILHYMNQDNSFSIDGLIARDARGPMGLWAALGSCLSAVITGLVYVFVCLKAWAGAFGVGSVTQYIGAVTALTKHFSDLIEATGNLRSNTPFLQTTYQFLDIPNSMYQGSLTTEKRSDRQYEVEFRDVSFKYPGSEIWALRHVNMKFKVGRRLAIVGENGSGKTTFIKLLCRLYDPQEGQILLNGIDIRKYRYDDYMQIFSIVFQDFQLISQPLGNNVSGSMTFDEERVRQALIDAGFGDRLDTLPEGLQTQLYKDFTENGVDVSGGEAQKIAIARALYKDAPFIILDEPTAALDPIAEAEIYAKFNEISGDKTAIYISHRLSSCKFCDEIAVFHDGAVIQQGTHEQLLADEGRKYNELWNAQAQYYTDQNA